MNPWKQPLKKSKGEYLCLFIFHSSFFLKNKLRMHLHIPTNTGLPSSCQNEVFLSEFHIHPLIIVLLQISNKIN